MLVLALDALMLLSLLEVPMQAVGVEEISEMAQVVEIAEVVDIAEIVMADAVVVLAVVVMELMVVKKDVQGHSIYC